ncbi:hypothetical protein DERF_015785 [Dermatophagoides farinae]|uniref:Uncharacterized protein n=1 Tax=Dermatophagoides farinae TaxID=6954 RepID=A0A922KSX2_DERFA|nr:hypothetical protein DERF_015785 [Dermatophagoides farinae]
MLNDIDGIHKLWLFLGESKGIFQIKKNLVNKKKLLELFGVLLDPVNEFSNIGPTAAANELELNDELSSIVELVGDGDSSNDTIGFTSATITKTFVEEAAAAAAAAAANELNAAAAATPFALNTLANAMALPFLCFFRPTESFAPPVGVVVPFGIYGEPGISLEGNWPANGPPLPPIPLKKALPCFSLTSVNPLIFNASAVFNNGPNCEYDTFTSPEYIKLMIACRSS